jgi:hypothetical protein
MGAFDYSGQSKDCGLQKRDPHGPTPARSVLMVFQNAKVLPFFIITGSIFCQEGDVSSYVSAEARHKKSSI